MQPLVPPLATGALSLPSDHFIRLCRQGVHEEVKKIKSGRTGTAGGGGGSAGAGAGSGAGPAVVIRAVKSRSAAGDEKKDKGELMEQDQDGLEYSEEEQEMDIHEANEKLAQKGETSHPRADNGHG